MYVGYISKTFNAAEKRPVGITFAKKFLGYIFNKMKTGNVQSSGAVVI